MQNFAVLDLGTNTFTLLVADVHGGHVRVIHDEALVVRLGEAVKTNGVFLPAAQARACAALESFAQKIQKYDCQTVLAVGTACFRLAADAQTFCELIHKQYGIVIRIISGDEEARLTALATAVEFGDLGFPKAILDVGGGSTELIIQTSIDTASQSHSLPFGSVSLTEEFLTSDPASADQILNLRSHIQTHLKQYPKISGPCPVIASAGTATTAAALIQKMIEYDPRRVHKSFISRAQLSELTQQLLVMTIAERKALPGMVPLRADVIAAGVSILNEVVVYFDSDGLTVSDRGLRFGVLYEALKK